MKFLPLSEVLDIVSPGVLTFSGDRFYSATGDVDDNGNVDGELVNFNERPSRADLQVKSGDVLFARMQGTRKILIANRDLENRLFSTGFCALRPKQGKLDSAYLRHFLGLVSTQRKKDNLCSGATQKAIRNDKVLDLLIPLPHTLDEQRHISSVLDKAEAVFNMRRKAQVLSDNLLQSTFLEMFGDPVSNSMNWDDEPIKNMAVVTTGNTPPREVLEYYGDFIEWIKSDNINSLGHYLTKAKEGLSEAGAKIGRNVPAGSTLITCIAGSPSCIGNAAFADRTVAFNQQINALTPISGIEPQFLYCCILFSKKRIQAASTSGMKGMVSKGVLEQVRLICPPKPKREAFVRIFEKIITMQKALNASQQESEKLFKSLTSQYFTATSKI